MGDTYERILMHLTKTRRSIVIGLMAVALGGTLTAVEATAPPSSPLAAESAEAHLYYGSAKSFANVPRASGVYPTGRIIASGSTSVYARRTGCNVVRTDIQLQKLYIFWGGAQWITEARTLAVSVVRYPYSASWVQPYEIGRFRTRIRHVWKCNDGHVKYSGWVQSNAVDIGRGW